MPVARFVRFTRGWMRWRRICTCISTSKTTSSSRARSRWRGDRAAVADPKPAATEVALQRLVTVYVVTGLLFPVLPGTFLGVWNLVSISGRHSLAGLSPCWLQAHGHAQIFGWIGTFVIGIGYYSLSKMGRSMRFSVSRGWTSWALWTCGITLRWVANVSEWNWRVLLPVSAALQLTAFLIFFVTVSSHKPRPVSAMRPGIETWMKLVIASTIAFVLALLMNQAETIVLALTSAHPEIPHWLDQRYLFLAAWGFPVLAVWGFNARWLPVFLGLREPDSKGLLAAMAACACGVGAALCKRLWSQVPGDATWARGSHRAGGVRERRTLHWVVRRRCDSHGVASLDRHRVPRQMAEPPATRVTKVTCASSGELYD